jgi:hypothetical protein
VHHEAHEAHEGHEGFGYVSINFYFVSFVTFVVKAVFFLVAALRAGPLRLFPLRENPLTPRTPRIEPRTSNIELLKPYAPLNTQGYGNRAYLVLLARLYGCSDGRAGQDDHPQ